MGWMHDTLLYCSKDPVHRKHHHWQLSFAMVYEYHERFIMPISHDEVVHGKRALLEKMPGDLWQKFANLRLLLTYQWTRPGKKLQFMGFELGQYREWDYESSLDWHLLDDHWRRGLNTFMADLGETYLKNSPFWRYDHDPQGFNWISYDDSDNSVLAYARRDAEKAILVVLNFTPAPRQGYRIGVPIAGEYVEWLSSDSARYGGSDYPTVKSARTDPIAHNWYGQSIVLNLPPLGALVLAPATYRP
jgi:1,4-alpha-glucan branching enzyme